MSPQHNLKHLFQRPAGALRPALCAMVVGLAFAGPEAAHAAVSFNFSPESPLTGEPVTFVSTSSEATGSETWDLDRDGLCDDATGPIAQRSFAIAGDYTVKLCADGSILRRTVTIHNRPPVAAFTSSPGAPLIGDSVGLVSTSFDPDGPIASLAWDLDDDGAFDDGNGVTASLSAPAAGSYVVRLLVTDRDGASSATSGTVTVSPRVTGTSTVVSRPQAAPVILLPIVRVVAAVNRRGTRISSLTVTTPPESQVVIRCRGRGCPFRKATPAPGDARARASKLVRIHPLRGRLLRPGAVLEVWITRSGSVGRYTRFKIRKRQAPHRSDLCVLPGTASPVRCPHELTAGGVFGGG